MPSLFSFLPAWMPFWWRSTTNAEMPRRPAVLSVTAMSTATSPTEPCVMKFFEPFRTHVSPSRTAVVFVPPLSLPASGSVRPHAPRSLPCASGVTHFLFCASSAEEEDVVRAEAVVRRDGEADRAVHARELVDDVDVVDVRQARAAVLLGHEDAQHPELAQLREDVARKDLRLVPLLDVGRDLGLGEVADHRANGLLLLGERESESGWRGGGRVRGRPWESPGTLP